MYDRTEQALRDLEAALAGHSPWAAETTLAVSAEVRRAIDRMGAEVAREVHKAVAARLEAAEAPRRPRGRVDRAKAAQSRLRASDAAHRARAVRAAR